MANVNVTYDDLTSAAHRLTSGKDSIHSTLTELSNLIDQLTSNGFQTDHASVAYQDSYSQFTTGARQAIDGLEGLSQFLVAAAQQMQQQDQDLANSIQRS